jgi:hypothetical protein
MMLTGLAFPLAGPQLPTRPIVCRKFETSRRREVLSFKYYREVGDPRCRGRCALCLSQFAARIRAIEQYAHFVGARAGAYGPRFCMIYKHYELLNNNIYLIIEHFYTVFTLDWA